MNWVTFCVLFLILGVASWVFLGKREKSKDALAEYGLIGLLGALASMLLMTAFSFVPDDWSANRIAVPVSWLYGYPVYSSLENDPSNCNFYLPFGFAGYLPTALFSYFVKSPSFCLLSGWIQTLAFYFIPFIILLSRLKLNRARFVSLLLLGIVISLSNPALRYVATMIHVDAFGIFSIGTAVALLFPIVNNELTKQEFIISGCLLGLSFFIKQTFIPFSILLILWAVFWYRANSINMLMGLLTTTVCGIIVTSFVVDVRLMWLYGYESSSSVPNVRGFADSFVEFNKICWPFYLMGIVLVWFIGYQSIFKKGWAAFILILGIISSLFSIYTYTKAGADVNHFALPLYLFVLLILLLIAQKNTSPAETSIKFGRVLCICGLLSIPQALIFLNTYCGWYLWVNNSHKQAHEFLIKNPGTQIYFPWQPLASLMVNEKMYHLDQGLYYEESSKMNIRSKKILNEHLPPKPFTIAIRPFGANAFLSEKLNARPTGKSCEYLLGWGLYKVE